MKNKIIELQKDIIILLLKRLSDSKIELGGIIESKIVEVNRMVERKITSLSQGRIPSKFK